MDDVALEGPSAADAVSVGEPVDCVCVAAVLAASADWNSAASGVWRFAAALAAEAWPASRKRIDVGPGITIPRPDARRSIRCESESEEMLARNTSSRLWSALERSIHRPMLAFNLSSSTCMATIPASITPSSGIQLRPRTRRSISRRSGSVRTNSRTRACSGAARPGVARLELRTLGRGAVVAPDAP